MNYLSILTRTFDVLLDVSALYLGTFFLLLFFHYLSKERFRHIHVQTSSYDYSSAFNLF